MTLTVFPGEVLQVPSSFRLQEAWLPVLAIATFNVFDCAERVASAVWPALARPSAPKHAALQAANAASAACVLLACALGWGDVPLLMAHAVLAVTSGWAINVCFVGADNRAVQRGAPSAVRERTGALMQGLILLGVLCGLSLSTVIASVREALARDAAASAAATNVSDAGV